MARWAAAALTGGVFAGAMMTGQSVAAQMLLPTDDPSVLCPDGPTNCNPAAHGIKLFRVGAGASYGLGALSLADDEGAWGALGEEPSSSMASSFEIFGGFQRQWAPRAYVQSGLVYGGMTQQIETTTDEYEARFTYFGVPVELVTGAPGPRAKVHFLVGLGLGGVLSDTLERASDGEEFDLSDGLQEFADPDEPVEEGISVHAWMNIGLGLSVPVGPVHLMGVFRWTMSPTPLDVQANLMSLRGSLQLSVWY